MESVSKIVVAYTLFTLVQLLAASIVAEATESCEEKCGNMTISYPFGIKAPCFLNDGFKIKSNETSNKAYIGDFEIIDISLSEAVMRIYSGISFACYNSNGGENNATQNHWFDMRKTPYTFSNTRNKFTSVGCRTLAYIHGSPDNSGYVGGCYSSCHENDIFVDNAACSGIGCCQTVIPQGLKYIYVNFQETYNHSGVWENSPCDYAFLADDSWYKFNKSDVHKYEIYYRNNKVVPTVLDWAIGIKTCKEAKLDENINFACISNNSICEDSINRTGYTCHCASGYEGNPYIDGGCKDVDECKNETIASKCYGVCNNLEGSYNCLCPSGKTGNATIEGNCKSKKLRTTTIVIIIIVSLSTFLVAAIIYLIHGKTKLNKAKEKCFKQNGGLLLQAQINATQSVRFRIFSIKEIMKATNNFEDASIKGRGGQGIVYKGIIDCRHVAIKKSTMIDEKRVKEFVNEMYILSFINHKNVIQILGCCLEVQVPILVYEFIPRGTLYQRLQEKNQSMSLGYRIQIAIDCASALTYLHNDSCPTIVHRDVKSSNILLDENNVAKISDFGASVLPLEDINETGVPGTYGYLDPESLSTGRLTKKSDVYSFAVVILELLTRMKAVYFDESGVKRNLAETFKKEGLKGILDDGIKDVMTEEQISEFSELLKLCLKKNGSERPTMEKVSAWLRRMQELGRELSNDTVYYDVESAHSESSNQNTYTTQFYRSGNQLIFESDYNLTR